MAINPADPRPAYLQIADDLRAAIDRQELRDNDALPSLRELTHRYHTSPGTARKAIDHLVNEGVVVTRQGQGVFVRQTRRLQRIGTARDLHSAGITPIEVRTIPVPTEIAERLQLAAETAVVVRKHLLTAGGEPTQLVHSYYPLALVEGTAITEAGAITDGALAHLVAKLGTTVTTATEDVIARMPTQQERQALRLSPGTPVIELVRTVQGAGSTPIRGGVPEVSNPEVRVLEVSVIVLAGDRHLLTYEVSLG